MVLAVVGVPVLAAAPTASATGGGAGATGHGDEIITSILAAAGGGPRGGTGTGSPRCRTRVLSDEQVVFLFHVAASMPELLTASFLDAIAMFADAGVVTSGPPPTTTTTGPGGNTTPGSGRPDSTAAPGAGPPAVTYWELTVRICDGVADTMSVQPRTAANGSAGAAALVRGRLRKTTRLPAPRVTMSPPPRASVLGPLSATIVGEPVFFSIDPPPDVVDVVPYAGRTVHIHASPDHIEVFGGQPIDVGHTERCDGFGRRYDPRSTESPAVQARRPGACVLRFAQATGGSRRGAWSGYVLLTWRGSFQVDGGPWQPLDGLFSMSAVNIGVGEVDTAIQRAPRS